MKEKNVTDRLTFLAETFDVFECGDKVVLEKKIADLIADGGKPSYIQTSDNKILGIVSVKVNSKERVLKTVSVCSDVFASMIVADPSENKMYLQWMLNVFTRLVKDGKENSLLAAIRFVEEDLPQANKYLLLFEENKRKVKFRELCKASYSLKLVEDPTNINQYKSLAQLFDSVDPFIEKEPSAVERTLQKFVSAGKALIPVKDRKFTLYIPKTTDASVVFGDFANWCTARPENGMFDSYTNNNKKPNGKNSDIYIIINNDFFINKSKELFQIHFETNQLKDHSNGSNVSIFENVLSESEGISNFFKEELTAMAKGFKQGIEKNKYIDYLIKFGFAESLFELFELDTPQIKIMTKEIPRLPDMSRFTALDQLIICDANLTELHPSVGSLSRLLILSLTGNKIKSLPKEIGYLKNLEFINLTGNPVKDFPIELANLDKSKGGSLFRIAIDKDKIGVENLHRLKELLPSTQIG